MLCQFTFQNFQSYPSETTLDFQATDISEFEDSLLSTGLGGALLPVCVVYGPNGGGKTNLLAALACLISAVVKPIYDLKKNRVKTVLLQSTDCVPFLFDEASKEKPTDFEIFFRRGRNEYRYCLSLREDEVLSESLSWRAIGGKRTGTVFERTGAHITLGTSVRKTGISRSVNPKMPYLSFLAINYDIPIIAEVQRWFESCIIRNYGNPSMENEILFFQNTAIQEQLIRALNDMDIDITACRFDAAEDTLYTQRRINGKVYELPLYKESAGTMKLISALPVILLALQEGRLVIFDELDAKLHPKLLRYVIALFKNKSFNTKGAQLLFTSQDMTTMKNTVFRRDEIWFAALNAARGSELYSLYEIRQDGQKRVNSTEAFDKQYLEGRYGADPYLSCMLTGGEWA